MPGTVRAIRGAVQVDADLPAAIHEATRELVTLVLDRNSIDAEDVISLLFTTTPDLRSAFPAAAARELGLHDVPSICATEIPVPGSLPRVVRLLAHVESTTPRSHIKHVYLRGAQSLRPDLVTT